jgi:hypothetical protein
MSSAINKLDEFFLQHQEPLQSTLMAIDTILKQQDKNITVAYKYGGPFYHYKGRMFAYLWVDKITKEPYIGFVEGQKINHIKLEIGDRKRIAILRCNTQKDLPVAAIKTITKMALAFYKKGIIATKEK